jgi:nudix-type nucleoside diphosphatase (YffH/AdpP family)
MKKSIVKFIKKDILFKGWASLTSYVIDYTSSAGKTSRFKREVFDSGDGAAVLMYDAERKKILLIRQYRIVAHLGGDGDGWMIECCAVLLDQNNPETAIIREIEEETGYKIENVNFLFEAYASPGAHQEKIFFYTAAYDASKRISEGGGLVSEHEDIENIEFDYNEISDLIKSGTIIDQKTIILLQWALLNLL